MPQLPHIKREAFCQHYALHGDGAKAAREAGYSGRRARQAGHELLQREDVKGRLEELRAEIAERNKVTADEVIAVFRSNIQRAYDNPDNPKWGGVANYAAAQLGKTINLFPEKHDHQHAGTVRHEHYDARVPLTEDERANRLRLILEGSRN